MAGRSSYVVPAVGVLSALTSTVGLQLADSIGHPLPSETANLAVIGAGAGAMAVLLRQRTPANALWRVLLLIALNGPVAVVMYAVASASGHPPALLVGGLWLLDVVLVLPWVLVAGLFPDGHRPAGWWTTSVVAGLLLLVVLSVAAWLTAPVGAPVPVPGHLPGLLPSRGPEPRHDLLAGAASLLTGALPLAALGSLVPRYRRSGPVARQQIRVGIVGLAASVMLEVLLRILPGAREGRWQLAGTVVAVGLGQLAFAAALLRWRLWLVDQALPRAVVLGSCSAAFTGLIVVGALLATGDVRTSQLRAAVVAAAVVTVLVQGYSRRLEPWVRRIVYGRAPSGFGVLEGLSAGLSTMDDQAAAQRLAEAARVGLAVPWAAVWIVTARPSVHRLAATAGPVSAAPVAATWWTTGPQVRLAEGAVAPTSWPADSAALAMLGPLDGPWGLLAVGQRRGDPLTGADLELLSALVRESELARTNRQLTDQVSASVDELEVRAVALQVSRQRLVAAQDAERRRIERDLHDGAQHELVSLAGELRHLARAAAVPASSLEQLACRAESAVFALQDLARGIYPSVLTDHGLVPAVRSFAGRLPLAVVLQVAPDLAGSRWAPEIEVALYFVAVESLGNSRKHAAATRTTVTLANSGGALVLEVHDDGVGFAGAGDAEGSGLQYMADRMAALGGRLEVEGRPGEGTWVTATVPVAGPLRGRSPTPAGRPAQPGHGG